MNQAKTDRISQNAIDIWSAAVDAVRAKALVQRTVKVDHNQLQVGDQQWSLSQFDRIIVIGAGKAATAMADGLVQSLDGCLSITGWINVPEGTEQEIAGIKVHPARPAGVNEPTLAGVQGAEAIFDLVSNASEKDLCIALISGGGSALLPAPIDGITLDDKLQVTRFLSGAGANIRDLNTVRKHLSRIKGGGLLRACRAGQLITLVLSDVLGDPLDLIASGPTVPDSSTTSDAIEVLEQYDPDRSLPNRVYAALTKSPQRKDNNGLTPSTIVIGNNRVAVDAAEQLAKQLDYETTAQSAQECEGAAEVIGRELADWLIDKLTAQPGASCLISGGEPIVHLAPAELRGRGGRNQQLVLAAYVQLLAQNLTADQWRSLVLLSGGTDGEDGPTDAAGAFIDAHVHQQSLALGLDPADFLQRNDAYTYFSQTGGLLQTGPTGTNVCDVRVALVIVD